MAKNLFHFCCLEIIAAHIEFFFSIIWGNKSQRHLLPRSYIHLGSLALSQRTYLVNKAENQQLWAL